MTVGVARTYGDEIELHADCRLSVAANPAQMAARFEEAARNAGLDVIETKTTDPVFIEKTDPRVQALQKAYFEMTGDDCPPYTMGGGTYSRCMENAITFGLSLPQPVRRRAPAGDTAARTRPTEFLYIPHWITGTMILLNAVLALGRNRVTHPHKRRRGQISIRGRRFLSSRAVISEESLPRAGKRGILKA